MVQNAAGGQRVTDISPSASCAGKVTLEAKLLRWLTISGHNPSQVV